MPVFRYLLFLLFLAPAAYAKPVPSAVEVPQTRSLSYQPQRFGDYEVHYSAFNSTFISPEVAAQYHLKRDTSHGVVNIAVRNVKNSETGTAVTGEITGQHKNLMTQVKSLKFKEVKEGDAIYYLADFKFSDEELLKFSVDVKPSGSQRTETVQFEQTFYKQ